MPSNSITYLNWMPIFEWYVVECGSKNGYPKDMCVKEMGTTCSNYRHLWNYILSGLEIPEDGFSIKRENIHPL